MNTENKESPLFLIRYRDKEYKIETLFKESNDLLMELILPKEFNFDLFVTDFGLANDKGYAISGEKFCDLYSILGSARFALYNAHLKIHNNKEFLESDYTQTLWLRSQYLQNSIIWYNSCEDYILQILWFAFDFFSDIKNYEKEMARCRYSKIISELEKYKELTNCSKLLSEIMSYHEDEDVTFVRTISNLLKHKQLINIIGLNQGRQILVTSNSFSSNMLEKKWIDLDSSINRIKNVHKKIIVFGQFLLNFIDFNEMFVRDYESKNILLMQRKNKREYKKMIINECYAT